MFFMVLSSALLVVGICGLGKAIADEAAFLRVRRSGVEISADVVGNDASPSPNQNAYHLNPVVRYHVDGRAYEAAVCNPGSRGHVGSGMTILVHPDHPYAPYDRYGGIGTRSRNLVLLFACTVALFVLMLATR